MNRRITLFVAGAAGLAVMFAGLAAGAAGASDRAPPCVRQALVQHP